MDQFLRLKKAKIGPVFNSAAYMCVCTYIVKLKTGPRFGRL